MLAFDDTALARIFIAATNIPTKQRSRWLRDIAVKFEGGASNAIRLRRFRARQRNGQNCFTTTHDRVALEEFLIAAELLPPAERDDHAAVQRALQRFIDLSLHDK